MIGSVGLFWARLSGSQPDWTITVVDTAAGTTQKTTSVYDRQ